jgi:hypothetical protein
MQVNPSSAPEIMVQFTFASCSLRHSRGTLEFRFEGRDSNRATRMAFRALSNDDRYKLPYRNQKSFSSLEIRPGSSEI